MSEVIKPQTVPELESRGWTFETAEGSSDTWFPFRLELLRPSRGTKSSISAEILNGSTTNLLRRTSVEQGYIRVKIHGDLSKIDDNVVVGLYSTQRRMSKKLDFYDVVAGEPVYITASFPGPKLRNPLSGPVNNKTNSAQSVFGATDIQEIPMYLRLIPDPESGEGVFILGHPSTLEPLTLGAFVGTKCHVSSDTTYVRFYRHRVKLPAFKNCTHRGESLVLLRFDTDETGWRKVHQVSDKRGYAVNLALRYEALVSSEEQFFELSYIPDTM